MDTQIICPSCKKPIPISEALSHQVQEKIQKEKEEYRAKMMTAFKNRVEEERQKIEKAQDERIKEHENKLKERLTKELELQMKDKTNEAEELQKMVKALQDQLLEASKQKRQMQQEREQMKLDMEKQLTIEQEKIRVEEQKRIEETHRLKMLENEKKLQDAIKVNEELKRKLEQGSQQAQGEVLELHVADVLRREFPLDVISDVPKGKFGADLVQVVRNRTGHECGTIVWELKRTKSWIDAWVPKLKEDQRQMKAEIAVLISEVLPGDIKLFGVKEGIWVGNFQSIVGLAILLRKCLLDVALVKSTSTGKKEKMEVMWDYLTSVEFKQRVESIIEVFSNMRQDIESEQRWFQKKWAKQEKDIRRVIDNTAGMYGSLESIMGKALPEVHGLTLDDGIVEDEVTEKGTLF